MGKYTNNNPGNIRKSSTNWKGEIPSSTPFENYSTEVYGWRSLIKNLQTIILRGDNTIWKAIHVWAPWGDGKNNPDSYSFKVSQRVGVNYNSPLSVSDYFTLGKIANAIATVEHGVVPDMQNVANIGAAIQIITAEQQAGQGASANVTPNTNMGGYTLSTWKYSPEYVQAQITQAAGQQIPVTTTTAQMQPVTLPDGSQVPYMTPAKKPFPWLPVIVGTGLVIAGAYAYNKNKTKNYAQA